MIEVVARRVVDAMTRTIAARMTGRIGLVEYEVRGHVLGVAIVACELALGIRARLRGREER